MIGQAETNLAQLRSDIDGYNAQISERLTAFKGANSGTTGQVFDTASYFETAIKDPAAYGAPDATCTNSDGVSCLWYDTYHPGQAIHELVAQGLGDALSGFI